MKRIVSSAALVAAAALTFSLGSPVAANASESAGAKAKPDVSQVAPKATTSAASGGIRISTGYITSSTYARAAFSTSISGSSPWRIRADVYVNGVKRTNQEAIAADTVRSGSVYWPRSAGFGTVQLRNVTIQTSAGTTALADSNVAPVKRTLDYRAYFKINKRGSKIKAVLTNWRVYQPNGSLVRGQKAMVIQRKVGKKWKKVKVVKLNAKGKGVAKFSSKKKYKYRALMKSSATVQGGAATLSRKI